MNHVTSIPEPVITAPAPGMIATLRTFPRPVWVLCGGSFLNKFGTFVIPFLALYMTQQGFSLAQAGLAISAYGVGNFLASIIGGHLADTIGRRKTIVISMGTVAVSMLLLSQARSFPAIIILTAITGLTGELYRPAGSALLADLVPAGQRVTVYAVYRLAFNAGWAFGPATAGFLATHSFTWLFIGDAVTSLLFGLVAWFALPEGIRGGKEQVKWGVAVKQSLSDRRFAQVIASSLVIGLIFFQMSSTFGLQVTARGFSASTYGALISLNGVLVVLFELPLTSYIQRFPRKPLMAVGYVLIGLGFASTAFAATVAAFALAITVLTLGEMISMPVGTAYIADLAPAHMRGRYMGTYVFAWSIALTFGPALGMYLFAANPLALWMTCGLLGLVAAGIILKKLRA